MCIYTCIHLCGERYKSTTNCCGCVPHLPRTATTVYINRRVSHSNTYHNRRLLLLSLTAAAVYRCRVKQLLHTEYRRHHVPQLPRTAAATYRRRHRRVLASMLATAAYGSWCVYSSSTPHTAVANSRRSHVLHTVLVTLNVLYMTPHVYNCFCKNMFSHCDCS